MKYLIIILLTFSFQLSAQSAGSRPSTTLTSKENAAYQAKAESKVSEFYGYLELLTDPKGNAEMKQQATESAIKLFTINCLTQNIFNPKAENIGVALVLASARQQKQKHTFSVKNFDIEPVSETLDKKEWRMTYTLLKNGNTLNISQLFYIVTENKQFGNTTKKVTNTYLGAIIIE